MCEKQICRFDGKATETAIPEIDRKWLSSMMWHCLNKQRICLHNSLVRGFPETLLAIQLVKINLTV